MEKIIAYAKAEGYNHVEYTGEWLGCEVYNPYFENEDEQNPPLREKLEGGFLYE